VRRLAALVILLAGTAALRPLSTHGQSPLTPVWLVLPIVYTEASDWASPLGPTVAYDDWSDDVFNPRVEALSQAGGAKGEAVIGLAEWAKASAGPRSFSTAFLRM
jgi:hypothetical protein